MIIESVVLVVLFLILNVPVGLVGIVAFMTTMRLASLICGSEFSPTSRRMLVARVVALVVTASSSYLLMGVFYYDWFFAPFVADLPPPASTLIRLQLALISLAVAGRVVWNLKDMCPTHWTSRGEMSE